MAEKSTSFEDKLLNWRRGTALGTAPTTVYVAFFTVAPADDGTGGTEVSGNAYARQPITTSSGWTGPSTGTTPHTLSNAAVITFPTPTGSWGTIAAVGIYDASTAGNLLYWVGGLSQAIASGVVASFAIGALVISED